MSELSIQDCTSSKQHNQNDEALMVVNCNDADIDKAIEQESHLKKINSEIDINKIAGFVNSKLKARNITKLCKKKRSTICNHNNKVQEDE